MKLTGIISLYLVAVAAILFVNGCGSKSESPSAVVNKYHQAILDKDIETVMSLSVPDTDRKRVEALLEFRSEGLKRGGGLPPIVSEKISGDTAVVVCKFGPVQQDVNLVKVDGAWKVK